MGEKKKMKNYVKPTLNIENIDINYSIASFLSGIFGGLNEISQPGDKISDFNGFFN